MFDNFQKRQFILDDVIINYVIGGKGPPLLLLHGYPQTHVIWHKIAPRLAQQFTVIASDLRGYGDSSCPPTDLHHKPYSKRSTAEDQVALMAHHKFEKFFVIGHDRGGRVAHRMALDHPGKVLKLAVLDIAPTYTMYQTTDIEFARAYYHWFFLIQPFDLPERMIGSDPEYYLRRKLGQWGRDQSAITAPAFAEYLRCFTPETIHSSCEDYRASSTIDLEHDQEDLDLGRKISCPLLCLWGQKGFVGKKYDVLHAWSVWCDDIQGAALPCGHYLPEEAPEETLTALMEFFTG